MTDPRLAALEANEAERDRLVRELASLKADYSLAQREVARLRGYLGEAREQLVIFCAMLEDDDLTGGLRLYVRLIDNAGDIVVSSTIRLPYPADDPRLHDDWLEIILAQGSDKVAKEYTYALAQVQI